MRVMNHVLPISIAMCGALAASCREQPPAPIAPPSSASAEVESDSDEGRPALLTDSFEFTCSPVSDVACSGVFPVRRKAEVALLATGEDALRARIGMLRSAKKSIRIQALIFKADETGLHVSEILKQKKKDGVDVRVIVDAVSNLDFHTQWMYFDLKQHGIEVEGYEALYLHPASAEYKKDDPLRANKRFHDKMWIVDAEDASARMAVVGGLNVANEYFRIATEAIMRWRDQDVALRGAIVEDVTAAFDRNYDYFKGIKESRPALLNTDNSWKLARSTVSKIVKVKVPTWKDAEKDKQLEQVLATPAKLDFRPVRARFLQSRPRFEEEFIDQSYRHLIGASKKSVHIANAYFIPSRFMTQAIHDAVRRGVRVVIVTNSPETNDIGSVAKVSRYTYQNVLSINQDPAVIEKKLPGVEVREWKGLSHDEGTLHAKFAVVDGRTAIVGSFNLDPRSAKLNSETAVAFDEPSFVAALDKTFEDVYVTRSTAVTWEDAQKYHRPEDIQSAFDLLFALPMKEWL